MRVNWDEVPDGEGEFLPMPKGRYLVKILEVATKQGPKGEYWDCKYQVQAGEHKGRFVWDNLSLTTAAFWRVKLLYTRLDLVVTGTTEILPYDIIDGILVVTLDTDTYVSHGAKKTKNVIKEFHNVNDSVEVPEAVTLEDDDLSEDDIPF